MVTPIRLKGKCIKIITPDNWTGEIGSGEDCEIEIPPLSKEPCVGDEVLVKFKIFKVDKDGFVELETTPKMTHPLDIVAILPAEEKCECYINDDSFKVDKDTCPIHGSKQEEKCTCGFPLPDFERDKDCPIHGFEPPTPTEPPLPSKASMDIVCDNAEFAYFYLGNKVNKLIDCIADLRKQMKARE